MSQEIHQMEWIRDIDNDVTVTVSYHFYPGLAAQTSGPPEHCWPAESAEVEIIQVLNSEDSDIELSLTEIDEVIQYILENHDADELDWDRIREDRWERSRLEVEYND